MRKLSIEMPNGLKTFLWILLCCVNAFVVFAACYTSAKTTQGFTLSVTGFVVLLISYAFEKRWRPIISWPLIAYAFYSILVCGYTTYQSYADRALYEELGGAYTVLLYAGSNIPYIFMGVSIVTAGVLGYLVWKRNQSVANLLKISFAANMVVFLLMAIFAH